MNNLPPDTISRQRLARIGTITAGFTHDIRNVLAVINESIGLVEDIMASGNLNSKGGGHHEMISKALASVSRQIERGTNTCVRMSRFAHTMDRDPDAFSVNEVLDHTAFLMQRSAANREVTLSCRPLAADIRVSGSAFDATMMLCEGLAWMFEKAISAVVLDAQPQSDHVLLRMLCEPALDESLSPHPEVGSQGQCHFEVVTVKGGMGGLACRWG